MPHYHCSNSETVTAGMQTVDIGTDHAAVQVLSRANAEVGAEWIVGFEEPFGLKMDMTMAA